MIYPASFVLIRCDAGMAHTGSFSFWCFAGSPCAIHLQHSVQCQFYQQKRTEVEDQFKISTDRAFSCDVIAAMLEGKNNTFSLPWEIRSIFTQNCFIVSAPPWLPWKNTPYAHIVTHTHTSIQPWINPCKMSTRFGCLRTRARARVCVCVCVCVCACLSSLMLMPLASS